MPEDWKVACIISVYKGKEGKGDCVNYRVIWILNVPRKLKVNLINKLIT